METKPRIMKKVIHAKRRRCDHQLQRQYWRLRHIALRVSLSARALGKTLCCVLVGKLTPQGHDARQQADQHVRVDVSLVGLTRYMRRTRINPNKMYELWLIPAAIPLNME